ncbi:MAG: ribosome maturation factor RimM [Anaerolineales bacterium]
MNSQRRRHADRIRNKETGSLKDGEPVFVLVGVLRRPHGLRGEVLVVPQTDFPERLKKGLQLYLGEEYRAVTIQSRRQHNDGLLLAFEEFPDKASLDYVRNEPLFVRREESPALPEGQYYQHQLLGLKVIQEDGAILGKVSEILDTSANAVYVVRTEDGEEILLPSIKDVIRKIDLKTKQITVHLLSGLIPDEK